MLEDNSVLFYKLSDIKKSSSFNLKLVFKFFSKGENVTESLFVVYFDSLSSAGHTGKVIKILFWADLRHLFFFATVFYILLLFV